MPSLPSDNSRKGYSTDAFRRYLPSKYVKDYDTDGASNTSIAWHFCRFSILLWIAVLIILFPTWLSSYFKATNFESFEHGNFDYIDDAYWFFLQTLFCWCFILILYRRIPREHVQHCVSVFGDTGSTCRWYLVLLLVSLFVNTTMYCLNCILLRIHLARVKSFVSIACTYFVCESWDYYLIWTFIIFPALSIMFTCMTVHYFLFGFDHNELCNLFCCCCCCCSNLCVHTREPNYYQHYRNMNGRNEMSIDPSLNTWTSVNGPTSSRSPPTTFTRVTPYYPNNSLNPSGNSSNNTSGHNSINPSVNVSINGSGLYMGPDDFDSTELQIMQHKSNLIYTSHIQNVGSPMSSTNGSEFGGHGKAKSLFGGSNQGSGERGGHFNKAVKFPEMKMLKYIFWYCFLFSFTLLLLFIGMNFKLEYYLDYFRTGYIVLLVYCLFAKLVLKKVARLIDRRRYHTHRYTSYTYFSVELLTEFLISCVYWISLRAMTLFGIPGWDGIYMICTIHILTEIYSSMFKPSKFYFKITKFLQDNPCYKAFLKCFFYELFKIDKRHDKSILLFWNFNDDSNIIQWRIRNSLDITMRILASITSTIVIIGQLGLRGDGVKDGRHDKGWMFKPMDYFSNNGTWWLLIISIIEIIFFILLYIYNICFNNFCILEPFYALCQENERLLRFCLLAMIIEAFWFPNVFTGDYMT